MLRMACLRQKTLESTSARELFEEKVDGCVYIDLCNIRQELLRRNLTAKKRVSLPVGQFYQVFPVVIIQATYASPSLSYELLFASDADCAEA